MEHSLHKHTHLHELYQLTTIRKIGGLLFLATLLFLFLFKPFVVNEAELKYAYLLTCFIHSLSAALIFIGYFVITRYVQRRNLLNNKRLTFHLPLSLAAVFFIVGLASFLLRDLIYNNPDNWSLRYLWEEIRNTYLAGSLFSSYFLFANYYFRSSENWILVDELKETEGTEVRVQFPEIFIKAHVKIDDFNFNPSTFVFARAEGNYIEITTQNDSCLKKELKRISLKQFELQVSAYTNLIRCHRTYVVNIEQVDQVRGNSQGYQLSFQGTTDKVPVSRANLEIFDRLYVNMGKSD